LKVVAEKKFIGRYGGNTAWLGCGLVLLGRALLAAGYHPEGFAVSVAGDAAWMWYGIKNKIPALYLLDGILLMLDLSGMFYHLC